jgi:hypothetical protein
MPELPEPPRRVVVKAAMDDQSSLSDLSGFSQTHFSRGRHAAVMQSADGLHSKVSARDGAQTLLSRLTAWIAFSALAAVGVLSYVSAATIPGSSGTTGSGATASTSTASSDDSGSTSGLQATSGSFTSSSTTGVAVSGGSR